VLEISKITDWIGGRMLADCWEALRQDGRRGSHDDGGRHTPLGIEKTAIFTLVHQVMLKSLPVRTEELWRIGDISSLLQWGGGYTQGDDGDFSLFSWEAYKNFRAQTPEFVDLAALQAGNARSASVEQDRQRRRIHAMASLYPAISSGLLACSPGQAVIPPSAAARNRDIPQPASFAP